jgi:photosystem II stability/assembly factor-like uncharacterized protein
MKTIRILLSSPQSLLQIKKAALFGLFVVIAGCHSSPQNLQTKENDPQSKAEEVKKPAEPAPNPSADKKETATPPPAPAPATPVEKPEPKVAEKPAEPEKPSEIESPTPIRWKPTGWGGGAYYWTTVWHPTKEGTIYQSGDCNGVYRSDDHGLNWKLINNGLANYAVYSMAVDKSNPGTVYALTQDGLCKSENEGEEWRLLPQTDPKGLKIVSARHKSIRNVAVDPSNGKNIFVGTPTGKVYQSANGGESWNLAYELKSTEQTAEEELRVQYGKVNGAYFGDIALPVAMPEGVKAEECQGLGFTLRAGGTTPKESFVILTTSDGKYRSKNMNAIFNNTQKNEVILKAEDFEIDPETVKKLEGKTDLIPSRPEWVKVNRVDISCSGNLPAETHVAKFSRFFFVVQKKEGTGAPELKTFREFTQDKNLQFFGNIRLGPPATGPIHSVIISSQNPSQVIAATSEAGLVLSQDGGKTWKELETPKKASCAAFDPNDENVIYGSFFAEGIWKSKDKGKTWTNISQGFGKNEILEVVLAPGSSQDLYAIGNVSWSGVVFISHDAGATWKSVNTITVDKKWNPTGREDPDKQSLSATTNIAISPHHPKEIYISANWRSIWSNDGGETWVERERGADMSCIHDIRFSNGKVYAGAMDEGTFVSENNGETWRVLWPPKTYMDFSGHNWRIAVNGDRILSTFTPWNKKFPPRVIMSQDAGKSYKIITEGLPTYTIRPNTMWGEGHPRALAVDPRDSNVIYLGIDGDPEPGKSGGGVFKSVDGGTSWTQLANQPGSRRVFYGLGVDPTDSNRVYWGACGEKGGVWGSADGGATWTHLFKNETWVFNLLVGPKGELYAGGKALWKSVDHGATWTKLHPFNSAIVGMEIHPSDPNTLWISTSNWGDSAEGGGIFKTTDGGATWMRITGDIPYRKPLILRYNPETQELWAGGVGLYKLKQN